MKAMKLVSAIALVLVTVACGQQQSSSVKDVSDDSNADATFEAFAAPVFLQQSMAGAFALNHRSKTSVVFEMDFTPGSSQQVNISYGYGSGTVTADQFKTTATPQSCKAKVKQGWTCTYKEDSGLFTVTIKLVDAASSRFVIDSMTDTHGESRSSGFNSQMLEDGTSGSVSCDAGVGLCDFGSF